MMREMFECQAKWVFASSLGRKPHMEPLGALAKANILFKITNASSRGDALKKAMQGQPR